MLTGRIARPPGLDATRRTLLSVSRDATRRNAVPRNSAPRIAPYRSASPRAAPRRNATVKKTAGEGKPSPAACLQREAAGKPTPALAGYLKGAEEQSG
jgi:hypothetical protein